MGNPTRTLKVHQDEAADELPAVTRTVTERRTVKFIAAHPPTLAIVRYGAERGAPHEWREYQCTEASWRRIARLLRDSGEWESFYRIGAGFFDRLRTVTRRPQAHPDALAALAMADALRDIAEDEAADQPAA